MIAQLEPSLGRTMADPDQIHQVPVNLLMNARDAMPSGGTLITETANVELDKQYAATHPEVTAGSFVRLGISDTGEGMDDSVRAHIFEPFFTTRGQGGTSKGESGGTGLGLATTYGIVRQSGGWIWVYSEPGKGTSFSIYFPRVDITATAEDVTPNLPDSRHGTETVLLVEDREDVRKLAREALEGYGYKVLEATNGELALELARWHTGRIDLLLTDVVMPGMNGREVSDRLKESRPDVKVLCSCQATQKM
jgi:hypothetical protein